MALQLTQVKGHGEIEKMQTKPIKHANNWMCLLEAMLFSLCSFQ
jgi:hypothetical protein